MRLRKTSLAEGIRAAAAVGLWRRRVETQGVQTASMFDLGRRGGRDEIEHEQNQAKHVASPFGDG